MYNTLCLVVIFRNEESRLPSLIGSVSKFINYAVFLDSSSNDDSHAVIELMMRTFDIPFEIHNFTEPFRGDTKRTRAVELARGKADYLLLMDADNTLEVEELHPQSFKLQLYGSNNPFRNLTKDAYFITKQMRSEDGRKWDYPIISLVRGDQDWKFVGIIHDFITNSKGDFTSELLPGCIITEPAKSDTGERVKTKMDFYDDALKIERELVDTRKTISPLLLSRYNFYLGRSYFDAGMWDRAITAYSARVLLGGWPEEVYYSLLEIAKAMDNRGDSVPSRLVAWCTAYNSRPQRKEAAYGLIRILIDCDWINMAWAVYREAEQLQNNDWLIVDKQIEEVLFPQLGAELLEKIKSGSPQAA